MAGALQSLSSPLWQGDDLLDPEAGLQSTTLSGHSRSSLGVRQHRPSPIRTFGEPLQQSHRHANQRRRRCCNCWNLWPTLRSIFSASVYRPELDVAPEEIAVSGESNCAGSDDERVLVAVARLVARRISSGDAGRLVSEGFADQGDQAFASPLALPSESAGNSTLSSADFDEALFMTHSGSLRKGWRGLMKSLSSKFSMFGRRRGLSRSTPVPVGEILWLLRGVVAPSDFRHQVAVVGAIYIERLLENNPQVHLTVQNWRPILVAALHLATKTWEDVHLWNAEFSQYMQRTLGIDFPARTMYVLETKFLLGLKHGVAVSGELYAAYLFALRDEDQPESPVWMSLRSRRPELAGRALSEPDLLALSFRDSQTPESASSFGEDPAPQGAFSFSDSRALEAVSQAAGASALGLSAPPGFPPPPVGTIRAPPGLPAPAGLFIRQRSEPSDLNQMIQQEVGGSAQPELDPRNPNVGWFRHAPRAAPPSVYIARRRPPAQPAPFRRVVSG